MNMLEPFSFNKVSVGFDDMFKRLRDMSESLPKIPSYPPYNIKKIEDNKYVIEIAVAGFGQQDIEVEMNEDTLTVRGQIESKLEEADYIFKGIADRSFKRSFTLADSVEVKNAELLNGMLKIWLERFIPEEKKPKKIPVSSDSKSNKKLLTEEK